ncbi:MAG: HAD-IB family hydrolase [Acidimicrobiia bacterium]
MTGAAFFDLDRTLLAGASGTVFASALKRAGLMGHRSIPGERLLFGVYNAIGETLPSMLLARQAGSLARGRSVAATIDAAREAAVELAASLQPHAPRVFAQHRAAGRLLVLATTTPEDLVRPFAELLGFDDVVATRYRVVDGCYDGSLDGEFTWAGAKLRAVRAWSEAHGVSLDDSWAYSDSFYDRHLLGAVGHPVAVNPDPRLMALAVARRWPILHLDLPPGVPKVFGLEPQRLVLGLTRLPLVFPYARFDIAGTEQIPSTGPAIVVANHRSYFDVPAIATLMGRTGRTVRFLGKREMFDAPIVGPVMRAMGGIAVDRGSGSDKPLEMALEALLAGELVALMPQGTIPRGQAFFDPVLRARPGVSRLVTMARKRGVEVPVIPVGLWGTEQVWPRSSRLPDVLGIVDPPLVTVRVGAPIILRTARHEANMTRIMNKISALLPPQAREARQPTPEELARTFPPGKGPDPS